jgi:phosphoesterase RecJ-like protein
MTAALESERSFDEAMAFLRSGDDYLVVSHVQPDGDAISSTLAAGWLLRKLGKRVTLLNEGDIPARLGFLPGFDAIASFKLSPPQRKFDRVVAVDCADFRRIGLSAGCFAEDAKLLNIDHHPTNDAFGTVNLIRPNAAATAEILFELIEYAGLPLDSEAATVLYTGLLTDTGGFRYSNTSPRVMNIASQLLAAGAPAHQIADRLLERMSMPQIKLLQRGLNRLTFTPDGRIGWLYIVANDMAETGAEPEDLEGLVHYARNVDGVEVGILFKEMKDGSVKASLRSAGTVDVSAIAQMYGGGGHVRAAGCRVDGPLKEAMARVIRTIEEAMN